MSFYSEIADYYDMIFPPGRGQADFVKACMKPPYHGKKILDVGSGTGDLAISLSEAGFMVTGIDYDMDMLARAEGKVHGRDPITFAWMDMRELSSHFRPSTFDAVLSFGNTLVHLAGFQEIAVFCKDVRTLLRGSGVFLLQILNYDHILDNDVRELPLIENDTVRFDRYYRYDAATNLITFKTVLTVKSTGARIVKRDPFISRQETGTEAALKAGGFTRISWYGDFDKGELKPDSLPLVVEARIAPECLPR